MAEEFSTEHLVLLRSLWRLMNESVHWSLMKCHWAMRLDWRRIGAMVMIDATVRLAHQSFGQSNLRTNWFSFHWFIRASWPCPAEVQSAEVLMNGNHKLIEQWQLKNLAPNVSATSRYAGNYHDRWNAEAFKVKAKRRLASKNSASFWYSAPWQENSLYSLWSTVVRYFSECKLNYYDVPLDFHALRMFGIRRMINMNPLIQELTQKLITYWHPSFPSWGHCSRSRESCRRTRERIQLFEGVVIKRRGAGISENLYRS